LDRTGRAWLVNLADPLGRAPRPETPLDNAARDDLLHAASVHGVLPVVARRLKSSPGTDGGALPAFVAESLVAGTGTCLALNHFGGLAIAALDKAGVKATLIKGVVAAGRLYPDPSMRLFGDVDLLVPKAARVDSRRALAAAGFVAIDKQHRQAGADYHEDKWHPADRPDLLIEIQDDLVHAPSLNPPMSLGLDDLSAAGGGDPSDATALLLLAAVHASVGHQFDRLQYLVDICQAARGAAGPVDPERLRAAARKTRTLLGVIVALDLAGRVFGEARCADLADRLAPRAGREAARHLLTPDVILSTQARNRAAGSWRRQLFRELLKWSARRG
jgi:hypothetical protein